MCENDREAEDQKERHYGEQFFERVKVEHKVGKIVSLVGLVHPAQKKPVALIFSYSQQQPDHPPNSD